LGKPEAFRAVASANGMNRIAIIIPCHRVIGEDGNLTGYAGGLARKKWLLDHAMPSVRESSCSFLVSCSAVQLLTMPSSRNLFI
jgi:alkylated DNA nucleotide flippase Atl1